MVVITALKPKLEPWETQESWKCSGCPGQGPAITHPAS